MMKLTNRAILLFIIAVAVLLRFWHFRSIPYTFDELSALYRTGFDSFGELIERGVKTDGHPALVQVFLFYLTRLFGNAEWIVKLPFALAGVLSVLLTYKVAQRWYNDTVGLVSAAFIASLQYTVFYSDIARPYGSGLFFSLLMAWFWTEIILTPDHKLNINCVWYVFASSLCTYNHHFSLLFAAVVWVSGLFLIQRRILRHYLLCAAAILILYIPHLEIFFYQLSVGGVESWLGKPRPDFLVNYFLYFSGFSAMVIVVIATLVLTGVLSYYPSIGYRKKSLLFAAWFFIPFLTGFLYSVFVNAVLQYSVLIFCFPFLLFLFFGHLRPFRPWVNALMVFVILAVNVFALVHTRRHYTLFYKSPFEQMLADNHTARQDDSCTVSVIDSEKKFCGFYYGREGTDSSFVWLDSFKSRQELVAFLREKRDSADALYLGATWENDPLVIPLIRMYFPYLRWQNNYAGGTTFLFSAKDGARRREIDSLTFDAMAGSRWTMPDSSRYRTVNGSHGNSYLLDSLTEFSPTFRCRLDKAIEDKNDYIDVSLMVRMPDNPEGVFIVASVDNGRKVTSYSATPLSDYVSGSSGGWVEAVHTLRLADARFCRHRSRLSVYVWNSSRRTLLIDDIHILRRAGNPNIYGLYESVPH